MKFEEKLQKLRKGIGLSQESLGESLGVSRQAISKWESGGAFPEMEKLIAISEIFGVTLDYLVKDVELAQEINEGPILQVEHINCTYNSRISYEYRSKKKLFGIPLVHISIGYEKKQARGVVAIGNTAIGVVSVGLVSIGVVSFGLVSAGLIGVAVLSVGLLLSVGVIAVGAVAIGAIAVGIFSIGALSVGVISVGAFATGTQLAIGDFASGHIAIGRVVDGIKTIQVDSTKDILLQVKSTEVKSLLNNEFPSMWQWIVNFISGFFAK